MVAPPSLERITVDEAVERFTRLLPRAVVTESLSPATADNYRRDLAEFTELAGPQTVLDDLTAEDLDQIVVEYGSRPDGRYRDARGKTRGLGATSRFKQSVSRLFTHATRAGWVQSNPVPDMQVTLRGRREVREVRTALSQASAAALLQTPEASAPGVKTRTGQDMAVRDLFALQVLMEVGPRASELCSADRADIVVDPDDVPGAAGGWFTIRHGKGRKTRRVFLSSATMATLAAYDQHRPTPRARIKAAADGVVTVGVDDAERALLLTWRGVRMRPRDLQNMVHRWVARMPAEVRRDVTPHGLRHTAATILLSSGAADVRTVRDILGHANVSTVSQYLDSDANQMAAAVRLHPVTARRQVPPER